MFLEVCEMVDLKYVLNSVIVYAIYGLLLVILWLWRKK